MFVNFCSKLAFLRFQQADFYITKDDTLSRTAARESLPKCFQLFQTAPELLSFCQRFSIVTRVWATEAGYRPVFAGCLPLKCQFFIFFQKTSVFVVFWVRIIRLLYGLGHQTRDVFCISRFYNSFSWKLVDESANNPILSTTDADFFIWHIICNHTNLTGDRFANSESMLRVCV